MVEYGYTKKDWALFREKIADWQEAYMDKLNKEYMDLLNGDGRPSEKFWALEDLEEFSDELKERVHFIAK